MLRHFLSLLLVLTLASGLWAAEPTRVTVTFRNGKTLQGELVSFSEGNYRLRTAGGVVVVAASRVARVEVRLAPAELCAAEEAANELALKSAGAKLPLGLFAVVAEGKVLGSRPTLAEARELAKRQAPDAAHCLVFRVGEEIPREVALGSSPTLLNIGGSLLDALGGKVHKAKDQPDELRFSTGTGELRFRAQRGQFMVPLLLGPADGRLELARLRVTRTYTGALTIPHELAVRAGLFRHALPGRVKIELSEKRVVSARPVRVRVAMGGLDLDRELIAHVLPPEPKPPAAKAGVIDVEAKGEDLQIVMERIAAKAKRTILVDPNVSESVTVSLREIPWRDAVEVIAKMTRCQVVERGQVLMLTQPPHVTIDFRDASVRTVIQLLAAYSGKNIVIAAEVKGTVTVDFNEVDWLVALRQLVKMVGAKAYMVDDVVRVYMPKAGVVEDLPKAGAWAPKLPEGPDLPRVTLEAKDLDLRTALASVAKQSGRVLLVDPTVEEKVTAKIRNRPWPEALRVLAQLSRCSLEERRGVILLAQPPRVTIQFTDANVRTVVQLLAAYSGKTIQLSPAVKGTLTLDLKEVDWRVALREIAATVGARVELTEKGGVVVPRSASKSPR